MVPGPFDICVLESNDDSESSDFKTITFGFDTLTQALEACEGIAKEHDLDPDDLVVVSAVSYRDWKEMGPEAWEWVKNGMK